MKKLMLLLLTFFSLDIVAKPVECINMSDEFYEDFLIINMERFSATYFDNDYTRTLGCKLDREQVRCCTDIDDCDSSRITVQVESDGNSYVIYGKTVIKFFCPLPGKSEL